MREVGRGLIAVTSVYHVHRATFLLGRCYDGQVDVVTPSQDLGMGEWIDKIPHEWAGFLGSRGATARLLIVGLRGTLTDHDGSDHHQLADCPLSSV